MELRFYECRIGLRLGRRHRAAKRPARKIEQQIARVGVMKSKTPTLGQSKSLIEEIFGNIGSISQPGLPGGKQ